MHFIIIFINFNCTKSQLIIICHSHSPLNLDYALRVFKIQNAIKHFLHTFMSICRPSQTVPDDCVFVGGKMHVPIAPCALHTHFVLAKKKSFDANVCRASAVCLSGMTASKQLNTLPVASIKCERIKCDIIKKCRHHKWHRPVRHRRGHERNEQKVTNCITTISKWVTRRRQQQAK